MPAALAATARPVADGAARSRSLVLGLLWFLQHDVEVPDPHRTLAMELHPAAEANILRTAALLRSVGLEPVPAASRPMPLSSPAPLPTPPMGVPSAFRPRL